MSLSPSDDPSPSPLPAPTSSAAANNLPADVLNCIQKRLPLVDYLRFPAVCTSWRSAAEQNPHPPKPEPMPWLFCLDSESNYESAIAICLPPQNDRPCKIYRISVPKPFQPRRIISSVDHYLITQTENNAATSSSSEEEEEEIEVHLVNPISWTRIAQLPSPTTLPASNPPIRPAKNLLWKVVTDGNIAVAKVHSSRRDQRCPKHLAYTRFASSGLESDECDHSRRWFLLETRGLFADLTSCKPGLFYAVRRPQDTQNLRNSSRCGMIGDGAMVVALKFSSSDDNVNLVDMTLNLLDDLIFNRNIPREIQISSENVRLVSSFSNLFLVRWRLVALTEESIVRKVDVYKLLDDDSPDNKRAWVPVKDLGNCSFFLGFNQSISLSATEFPELRGNYIYFFLSLFGAAGGDFEYSMIYNVGDGSWERFHGWDDKFCDDMDVLAVWITPHLDFQRETLRSKFGTECS